MHKPKDKLNRLSIKSARLDQCAGEFDEIFARELAYVTYLSLYLALMKRRTKENGKSKTAVPSCHGRRYPG